MVIGLAITDLATSIHRLLRHRRKVRWNWVAPLAALLVILEMFNAWWGWSGFDGATLGEVMPPFLALILLFLTASAVLPDDVPDTGLDLGKFFDEQRSYFWGIYSAYIAVVVTWFTGKDIQEGLSAAEVLQRRYFDYLSIAAYLSLTLIKPRWISGVAVAATLVWVMIGFDWWNRAPAPQGLAS